MLRYFQKSQFQSDLMSGIMYLDSTRIVPGQFAEGFISKSSIEKEYHSLNSKKQKIFVQDDYKLNGK